MLELIRYFPAAFLDLTWELESQLEVERTGDGPHNVQVHWHLDPGWGVEVSGRRVLLQSRGEQIQFAVSGGLIEHVPGTGHPGLGWHSPVYGRIEPTSAIRVVDSGTIPIWIVTVFDPFSPSERSITSSGSFRLS